MTIVVTDEGFGPDTWDRGYTPLGEAANDAVALDVPSDADPATIPLEAQIIRVDFPTFGKPTIPHRNPMSRAPSSEGRPMT